MVFKTLRKVFSGDTPEISEEEYLEIDVEKKEEQNKILVKLFDIRKYEDVTKIIEAIREGYTIAIIDIKFLKQRDPIELKRAISKVKKTTEALEGSIAGFGEHTVIVVPPFARIQREASAKEEEKPRERDW